MIYIAIEDFPNYEILPPRGAWRRNDSLIQDLEFRYKGKQYSAVVILDIDYERWYRAEDSHSPEEDDIEVFNLEVTLTDAWDEKGCAVLDEEELRNIRLELIKQIEVI